MLMQISIRIHSCKREVCNRITLHLIPYQFCSLSSHTRNDLLLWSFLFEFPRELRSQGLEEGLKVGIERPKTAHTRRAENYKEMVEQEKLGTSKPPFSPFHSQRYVPIRSVIGPRIISRVSVGNHVYNVKPHKGLSKVEAKSPRKPRSRYCGDFSC